MDIKEVFIKGYDNKYKARSDGKLFRRKANGEYVECSYQVNNRGYTMVWFHYKNTRKNTTLHRVIASAFVENPENKETVNHLDGNKNNNEASNLSWATRSENSQHMYDNKLRVHEVGSDWCMSKIKEEDALDIVGKYKHKTNKELAVKYKMTYTAIWAIRSGRSWGWLTGIKRGTKWK